MKKAFEILKDRPRLTFVMTRDSLCAGDDCDAPHEKTIELPSFLDPEDLARHAIQNYLPTVAGYGYAWVCILNGIKIAEVRYDGIHPLIRENIFEEINRIHWRYLCSAS